jgi:hypothetical protein
VSTVQIVDLIRDRLKIIQCPFAFFAAHDATT